MRNVAPDLLACARRFFGSIESDEDERRRRYALNSLATPYDLELVADLLQYQVKLNLTNLQEQYFELVGAAYMEVFGDMLPVEDLSQGAYAARLKWVENSGSGGLTSRPYRSSRVVEGASHTSNI